MGYDGHIRAPHELLRLGESKFYQASFILECHILTSVQNTFTRFSETRLMGASGQGMQIRV